MKDETVWPKSKPTDRPLSRATERLYDVWPAVDDKDNEFFTNFRYSLIEGIGKQGDVSRRDPSKIVKVGDTYYVWFTRRGVDAPLTGFDAVQEGQPAMDWDCADIYYATSKDGWSWVDRGVAVPRAQKGEFGCQSLSTPDILVFQGKYYLYYQIYSEMFDPSCKDCVDVSMAWADSPDGPWTRLDRPVVTRGGQDDWDGGVIHDPYPLVYKGQIWLFYKGRPARPPEESIRAQGVAISDRPEGPFVKSPLNPVLNSGHETALWPYRKGIAAIASIDGAEKNTIQFASDGLSFDMKATVQLTPIAAGPFCPDAFADNGDGKGITWGLCHLSTNEGSPDLRSYIIRFDCALHRDVHRPAFKGSGQRYDEHTYLQPKAALPDEWRETVTAENARVDDETISG